MASPFACELSAYWLSDIDFTSAICASCFSFAGSIMPVSFLEPEPLTIFNPSLVNLCSKPALSSVRATITLSGEEVALHVLAATLTPRVIAQR